MRAAIAIAALIGCAHPAPTASSPGGVAGEGLEVLDLGAPGLLIASRHGDRREIALVDGQRVRTLATIPDTVASGVLFGDQVVIARDHDGDERWQLERLGGDAVSPPDSRNVGLIRHGRQLAWASTARNHVDHDLWISDGDRGRLLLEREGAWWPVDWSPDGTRLLVAEYRSEAHQQLHVVDVATRAITAISDAWAASPTGRFGADGVLYVVSDRGGEHRRLWRVEGGAWQPISDDSWDVEAVVISSDLRTVSFVTDEDGASVLRRYDGELATVITGVPPGGVIRGLVADGRRLAFAWTNPRTPGAAYVVDLDSRAAVRWVDDRASDAVMPVRDQAIAGDGLAIPLWLYRRTTMTTPAPVVIDLHGGPELEARPAYDPLIQLLVARGYAVVVPDVRGSTGHGRRFASLDDGVHRGDAVGDVGAVLAWIARQPGLDAHRVATRGWSYGGWLAVAAAIAYPHERSALRSPAPG